MKRRALFAAFFLTRVKLPGQFNPGDVLATDWARFATEMNGYVEKLNQNVNDLAQLRRGLKAWRRMEADMGWKDL